MKQVSLAYSKDEEMNFGCVFKLLRHSFLMPDE